MNCCGFLRKYSLGLMGSGLPISGGEMGLARLMMDPSPTTPESAYTDCIKVAVECIRRYFQNKKDEGEKVMSLEKRAAAAETKCSSSIYGI